MAICKHCGAEISLGQKFCTNCGQAAEPAQTPEQAPILEPVASSTSAPAQTTASDSAPTSTKSAAPIHAKPQGSKSTMDATQGQKPQNKKRPFGLGIVVLIVVLVVLVATLGKCGGTKTDSAPINSATVNSVSSSSYEDDFTEVNLPYRWNGTWFGCLALGDCTGKYAAQSNTKYDVYVVVNVDEAGAGHYTVYLSGVEEALVTASCTATADGLYTTSGTVAGKQELHTNNWTFLPTSNDEDQYTMHDEIRDDDGVLAFNLFMKQWGYSWRVEREINDDAIPPSVEWYEELIDKSYSPPVGFIPVGYYTILEGDDAGGDSATAQGQVGGSLVSVFDGYSPAYNNNPVTLYGEWSGWWQESESRGDHFENSQAVRAVIHADTRTNQKYIEIYWDGTTQNSILSMWIENEPTDTKIIPIIGSDDAWILDQYLSEKDAPAFTTSVNPNRELHFSYEYGAESDSGCLIEITLHKD